jgi:hypothetical protein
MPLIEAHGVNSHLEEAVLQNDKRLSRINMHLEAPVTIIVPRHEMTNKYPELVNHLYCLLDAVAGRQRPRDQCVPCAGASGVDMFSPVVVCFGNHCNDVLDLLVQTKGWSGRQIKYIAFAPNADIFDYNSAKYPDRHFLVLALQANPP